MTRTTGTRITAWLGILAICLAVFMPGVNALKNQYLAHGGVHNATAGATQVPVAAGEKSANKSGIADIFLADICFGAEPENPVADKGIDSHPANAHSTSGHHGGQDDQSEHGAHAAECLYCGFFSHNLPVLLVADLPDMSYGFVSRIAPQHQHASYYARPAFVPLSRAPPVLS